MKFSLESSYKPSGDQPQAIAELTQAINDGVDKVTLLGVTGSGKTFTMANVIQNLQRPALILSHNKTLAAQLYGEFKAFFPNNAVEYFVSYYDYYQPEAYIPTTDTYIEKDSAINEQIDRLRHSATRHLLERRDVIVVSSVSCIYGIGDAESYSSMAFSLKKGDEVDITDLTHRLTELQYKRNDIDFQRGCFRLNGDVLDIFPSHYEDLAWRVSFFGDEIEEISEFDPLTGKKKMALPEITVFPASHYVTPRPALSQAIKTIRAELKERLKYYRENNQPLEAERIEQRTRYDLEMMEATGSCKGIENYSRHLDGRKPGETPYTLFDYFPDDFLCMIDEAHVTVPQIGAMYEGDRSRKQSLIDFGFRLPSALDNRPLQFDEYQVLTGQTIYVSATPADFELQQSEGVYVEQLIRPTGLLDPVIEVRPSLNQVDDLIDEIHKVIEKNQRVLVTTLTKRMAEELNDYLLKNGVRCNYIHSDVETLERIQIMNDLRAGIYDVLIGVNLLREGLDLPEVSLVAIIDADKEGFLRDHRSLTQTAGRAARNVNGKVILYADRITQSMQLTMNETNRRREKQMRYNEEHGITPQQIEKAIAQSPLVGQSSSKEQETAREYAMKDIAREACDPIIEKMTPNQLDAAIARTRKLMNQASARMDFLEAAQYRDEMFKLEALRNGKDGNSNNNGK